MIPKYIIIEKMKFKQKRFICSESFLVQEEGRIADFQVIKFPFQNCQVFSIASMDVFAGNPTQDSTLMDRIKEIKSLCKITNPLCQIDVRQSLFDRIKPHLNIHAAFPYKSTNSSEMVIALIKTI